MPSPFPGMDPYLEQPAIFPDLHDSLITYLREELSGGLPAQYFAGIGSRVWVESSQRFVGPDVRVMWPGSSGKGAQGSGGATLLETSEVEPVVVRVPEDEIREPFIEIYVERGEKRLVTTIEVLSPTNKTPGEHGRDLYLAKQGEILESKVHLVEIDLLRDGVHSTAVPLARAIARAGHFQYHVSVRKFHVPGEFVVYPIGLAQRLPSILIPLLPEDEPVVVNLQSLFDRCYLAGRYDRQVDYSQDPIPPLEGELATWARKVVTGASPAP